MNESRMIKISIVHCHIYANLPYSKRVGVSLVSIKSLRLLRSSGSLKNEFSDSSDCLFPFSRSTHADGLDVGCWYVSFKDLLECTRPWIAECRWDRTSTIRATGSPRSLRDTSKTNQLVSIKSLGLLSPIFRDPGDCNNCSDYMETRLYSYLISLATEGISP